ncbi:hypothetical protein D3W54_14745 [Komagataeibacter medellinensis]|uniref:Scaffolding protein n=1 Tax=Komagataeibacter medellinensis TaxID=1177712 RepID=A0ABQ6VRG7_9PROT|nr:hypothetical protein [Komagataeibacter medellinensis]KAB8122446.1 hypothetical protein D3W54_14745 [Komagataeibacter medellinensis]
MSEVAEAPAAEIQTEAPIDRFANVQFDGGDAEVQDDASASDGDGKPNEAAEQKDDAQSEGAQKDGKQPEGEPAWFRKRIDALTGKRKQAEDRAAQFEKELAEYKRALAHARGEQTDQEPTPDQIRQQERQRYEQQMRTQTDAQAFGAATTRVADSLAALHGQEAITAATTDLVTKAGLDFESPAHRQVIADISELPNSGAVYYALAQNPARAQELLDAPERRQFAILQRFADTVGKSEGNVPQAGTHPSGAPQISKAPPPVAANAGGGRPASGRSIYASDLSMDDYIRMRSKK